MVKSVEPVESVEFVKFGFAVIVKRLVRWFFPSQGSEGRVGTGFTILSTHPIFLHPPIEGIPLNSE